MKFKTHKDHRKKLTGSKAIDPTCRNHGTCFWCRDNRLRFDVKHRVVADEKLEAESADEA